MTYRVGFYTTASPLYGSKLRMFQHHDAVFNKLCKYHDVEFHVVAPTGGGSQFLERLYLKDDRSVLYPSIREMRMIFHLTPDPDIKLDALYLDDIHTYQDIQVGDHRFTPSDLKQYINNLVARIVREHKPLIFSDTDGFCTEILEDGRAEMMDLYNQYKDYDRLSFISPFHNPVCNNFYEIPFEVDPDNFQEIKPLSERSYLLRYVGNQYYREHFVPIFDKLSQVGRVGVNGAGWKDYKDKAPNVEWGPKIPMTPDGVNKVYSDSVLGLTGRSTFNATKGQEIYLYRWKEYLTAGTLIIPENLESYTNKLPEYSMTTDTIRALSSENLTYVHHNVTDLRYEESVRLQRDKALEFFGVDQWVPKFKEMLRMV